MKIIVLSCDKNIDTFEPFHHCMEKFWPDHPEIIYFTETVQNPYYATIPVPRPLEEWTRGVREFLDKIDDNQVLLMIDDIFIRRPVNKRRINYASEHLKGNIAMFNFEKSFENTDSPSIYDGFRMKKHGSEFEVSLMCGLWQKDKLYKVLERNCDPWTIELEQQPCGFDYYINSGNYIIDWGYRTFQLCGIVRGKWTQECIEFLTSEGLKIDFSLRGIREN